MAIRLMQIMKEERKIKVVIDLIGRTDVDIVADMYTKWDELRLQRRPTTEGDNIYYKGLTKLREDAIMKWEQRNDINKTIEEVRE